MGWGRKRRTTRGRGEGKKERMEVGIDGEVGVFNNGGIETEAG
jgi:hypothetical protein